MLKQLTEEQKKMVSDILSGMSLDEKIGQVLNINGGAGGREEIRHLIDEYHIGSFFIGNKDRDDLINLADYIRDTKIPVIINGDFINGIGSRIERCTAFPSQAACSATNDYELIEKMGEITQEEGSRLGARWTFGPVSDICTNPQNPMMHIRTAGDDKVRVYRTSSAFIRGVQKNGNMCATAKHFPGDGLDSRDTHITTLINHLSREEWMDSYGYIWKRLIDEGVMTIMSGHIALPFIDPEYEDPKMRFKGPRPATLSKKILTDFLRGELGFDGLIITDAINMIGLGSHLRREDYAPALLNAGNDVILWAIPELDRNAIRKALSDGTLSMERLDDACRRMLELKMRVGLFEDRKFAPMTEEDFDEHGKYAQQMADEAITIVRDVYGAVPKKDLKPGSKVLTITLSYIEGIRNNRDRYDLTYVDDELRKRGFEVDHLVNPQGLKLIGVTDRYDAVFVNFKYAAKYGSVRLQGEATNALKGSWWVDDPKVVFTAFGDPFKIYDIPGLHNYVCTYSLKKELQKAAVKVWLGEMPARGTSPWDMKPYLMENQDYSIVTKHV